MDESPLWHANDDDDLRSIEAFSVSFCSERWANDNVGTLHGVQDGTTTLDQEVSVSKNQLSYGVFEEVRVSKHFRY